MGTSRETRSHRAYRAGSKQANTDATRLDWSLPWGVCARACMCVCAYVCVCACMCTCVQGDLCLPAPQPTERSRGRPWRILPAPQRLSIIQGLLKVSLRIVLVLRMTRVFIFPTRLQVSSQEHLVPCKPNTDSTCPALTWAQPVRAGGPCCPSAGLRSPSLPGIRLQAPLGQSSLQHGQGSIPQLESSSPLSAFMETWGLTKFKVHREDNKEAHPTWPGRGLGAAAGQLRHSQLHQEALGAG